MSKARRIEAHVQKALELMHEIRDSDHPLADELYETLKEELGITSTNVPAVIERILEANP